MNVKSSLLALLGVSTIGGGVTGGYYLLRPNTTTNKQSPNKQKNTSVVNSESKDSLMAQTPTPPASPSPRLPDDSGTSSVSAAPSNISPSQGGAGVVPS